MRISAGEIIAIFSRQFCTSSTAVNVIFSINTVKKNPSPNLENLDRKRAYEILHFLTQFDMLFVQDCENLTIQFFTVREEKLSLEPMTSLLISRKIGRWVVWWLLTTFIVTVRSYCTFCPFFLFLPVLVDAALGVTLTCPFCAEFFWAGFEEGLVPGAVFCPGVGAFCPDEPFWFTCPTPSAGLLRAWKNKNRILPLFSQLFHALVPFRANLFFILLF